MSFSVIGRGYPARPVAMMRPRFQGEQTNAPGGLSPLDALGQKHPMVGFLLNMIRIPSPSVIPGHKQEAQMMQNLEQVRVVIAEGFKKLGIPGVKFERDPEGSMIIRVPGSSGYENRQPLLLMAHFDIVPASVVDPLRPINPQLIKEMTPKGEVEYIATDKTTTLGADDKAGIAVIWEGLRRLKAQNKPHVPLEILLSPDEETDNISLLKMDTSKLKSRHAIVVDNDVAFEVITGCASFVDMKIKLSGLKGGHSAYGDQETRISAADIITEVKTAVGNRIIKFHPDFPQQPLISKNIYNYGITRKATNALPVEGHLDLSLRSLSKKEQIKEIARIRKAVQAIEKKYKKVEPNIKIHIDMQQDAPAYPGNNNSFLAKLVADTAKQFNPKSLIVNPTHGATQANFLGDKKNADGHRFHPIVVIGPDNPDLHTETERVDWQSMLTVGQWLSDSIERYSTTRRKA